MAIDAGPGRYGGHGAIRAACPCLVRCEFGAQASPRCRPEDGTQDGGERWVPMFPELRPHLEEAFDRAAPGTIHVITRWRDADQNLRSGLFRILHRAGIKPWPRLYQNLRSSRETELAERVPIHVVAEWLGNSPKTALAHYTQVTQEHYRLAASGGAAQIPAQRAAALPRMGKNPDRTGSKETVLLQGIAIPCEAMQDLKMTPTGLEPVSRP